MVSISDHLHVPTPTLIRHPNSGNLHPNAMSFDKWTGQRALATSTRRHAQSARVSYTDVNILSLRRYPQRKLYNLAYQRARFTDITWAPARWMQIRHASHMHAAPKKVRGDFGAPLMTGRFLSYSNLHLGVPTSAQAVRFEYQWHGAHASSRSAPRRRQCRQCERVANLRHRESAHSWAELRKQAFSAATTHPLASSLRSLHARTHIAIRPDCPPVPQGERLERHKRMHGHVHHASTSNHIMDVFFLLFLVAI